MQEQLNAKKANTSADTEVDLIAFDTINVDLAKIQSEKDNLERTVLHQQAQIEQLKQNSNNIPSTSSGAFAELQNEIHTLQTAYTQQEENHGNEIEKIAKASTILVQKKVAEYLKGSRGSSAERPGKERRGSDDTEASFKDAMSDSDVNMESTPNAGDLMKYFKTEFGKINRTMDNHAQTLHKRIDELEAPISRQRAQFPGNMSLNDSMTSSRLTQPLTINMNAQQPSQSTTKRPQSKEIG